MKIRAIGWVVLFLLITACSRLPAFSLEVVTPPAAATATPLVAESPAPEAAGTQLEPTQEVLEKPVGFSPVLYGGRQYDSTFFLLLGGVSTDEWLTPEQSAARFSGEVTYSLHSQTQAAKYFLWGEAPEFSPTCGVYTIGTEALLDEGGFVAVVDGWQVTKRAVTEPSNAAYYQQWVMAWLTSEGVQDPQPGTLQVLEVNLEDDKNDEIFISATHLDDSGHTTRAGDYSVILMVKADGDTVITQPVIGDVYDSREPELTFPRTYTLANFIDLNQDGILEVVVEYQKWEGFGASVHQVTGQDVRPVLGAGC